MIAKNRLSFVVVTLLTFLLCAPGWSASSWDRAVEAIKKEEWDTAIQQLRVVIESQPDYGPAYSLLGHALVRNGQAKEAVKPYEQALVLDSEDGGTRLHLASTLASLARHRNSLAVLSAMQETGLTEQQREQWHGLLASVVSQTPPAAASVGALEVALQGSPEAVTLWAAMGRLREKLKQPMESMDAWELAATLDPSAETRNQFLKTAHRLSVSDSGSDAAQWLNRAVSVARDWGDVAPETALLVAEGMIQVGRCEETNSWLQLAKGGDHVARAAMYAGECASVALQVDLAIAEFKQAREMMSEDPGLEKRILMGLGKAHHANKEYRAAAESYRSAGATEEAAKMVEAQKIVDENAEFDSKLAECDQRREELQGFLDDNSELEGTDAWTSILRSYNEKMADCRPYLGDETSDSPSPEL